VDWFIAPDALICAREDILYGRNLQYIRVSEDRAILKRGAIELLLSGEGVHAIIELLLPMLDGRQNRRQILETFPEDQREPVDKLLEDLLRRRMITNEAEPETATGLESLQASFWWNFGKPAQRAPEQLRQARLLVVGANLISRSLVRSLLETGAGGVTLVDHAALNDEAGRLDPDAAQDRRLSRVPELPSEDELANISLICATSDFGQPDALLEVNRLALRVSKPFLPVWLDELRGYVGPLNYPYESACLRCYRARMDSNNPDYQNARAVREHISGNPQGRSTTGLLPPMAAVLGEIAAIEVTKFIAGFPPSDTVGRIIEMNLVSFGSTVRRVLKIPRCPDCSEVMQKATRAVTVGPQIPYSE
jgi:bacteriocin biosynthesis cyclodehydratase domain-containing protein